MCIHTTPHVYTHRSDVYTHRSDVYTHHSDVYTHHSSCVYTVHADHQEDVTKIWEDIQLMKACRGTDVVCAALTAGVNTLIAM